MSTSFSDEHLSAFIDGELAADERESIEAALEHDSALAERLRQLKSVDSLIATTYSEIDNAPMPDAVMALLQGSDPSESKSESNNILEFPAANKTEKRAFNVAAIAASVALLFGLAIGTQLNTGDRVAQGTVAISSIAKPGSSLYAALESQSSGAIAETPEGKITPQLSFRSTSGEFCREFTLLEQTQSARAVACRTQTGWQTRFASFSDAATPSIDQYASASSAEEKEFSNVVSRMMSEDALSVSEESELLNDWVK